MRFRSIPVLFSVWLSVFSLLLGFAPVARAEVPDPTSEVWARYALAAGRRVQVARDSVVVGNLHGNDRVHLQNGSRVEGDASSAGAVQNQGTVTGSVRPNSAAITLPRLWTEAEMRALADRVIESGSTLNNATVDDVLFVRGRVTVRGALRGTGTLLSTEDIRFERGSGGAPDPAVRLTLVARNDIRVDRDVALRGFVYAGRDVDFQRNVRFDGVALAGRDLSIDRDGRITKLALDTTPPLAISTPSGTITGDATPPILVTIGERYFDLDSVRLWLDGAPISVDEAGCRYGATQILCEATPLAAGVHVLRVEYTAESGQVYATESTFTVVLPTIVDTTAPVLTILAPVAQTYVDPTASSPVPGPLVEFSDADSGIDLAKLTIRLNRVDLTAACRFENSGLEPIRARCPFPLLVDGEHAVTAEIADRAGNVTNAQVTFTVDSQSGDATAPTLTVDFPANGAAINGDMVAVRGRAADDVGLAMVTSFGQLAEVQQDGSFERDTMLMVEGENTIDVAAFDFQNRRTVVELKVFRDTVPPVLAVLTPVAAPNAAPAGVIQTNDASLRFAGTASDEQVLTAVEINGIPATLSGSTWEAVVPLAASAQTVTVVARDHAGNTATRELSVRRWAPPVLTFDQPLEDARLVRSESLVVGGRVEPAGASVSVNGIAAVVVGDRFTAQVPLKEGVNYLTATAAGGDGSLGTVTMVAARDSTAPRITIDQPLAGSTLFSSTAAVSGSVLDLMAGARSPQAPTVTVNGVAATVDGGRYLAMNVPLSVGVNTLAVVATDQLGNTKTVETTVTFESSAGRARIEAVSGDDQSGANGVALPTPLVASVVDASGAPVAGVAVVFRVTGGDGLVAAPAAPGAADRSVVVRSDAAGRAAAIWTLGRQADAGRNHVEATAAGYAGRAHFMGRALPGVPTRAHNDLGNNQVGAVGRPLPRPLVVAVSDNSFNRLPGVPVVFEVVAGGGNFQGQNQITAISDAEGRAYAHWTLGTEAGTDNQRVRAYLPDASAVGATFVASALVAGDPAMTRLVGVVLDNQEQPIPGATASLHGTSISAQTDATGRFQLDGVPAGHQHLVVDGRTSTRPGPWPQLEFDLIPVPGALHELARPVYLPSMENEAAIEVSETEGGVLTLADVPGLSLTIEPGAATFPNGSKSGRLSIAAVHADKVPMAPGFGQQPLLFLTFQPPGVVLDPPARVTLPNLDGLSPGATAELYSFDHDQGQFVIFGTGTVSEDGMVVKSDPGIGILEGGWHAGCRPTPEGGACGNCGVCGFCAITDECLPDPSVRECDGDLCTAPDRCAGFGCTSGPRRPNVDVGPRLELDPVRYLNRIDEVMGRISKAISKVSTCDLRPRGNEGGFVVQEFETCCSPSGEIKRGKKGGGFIKVGKTFECMFTHPVLKAIDDQLGLFAAGIFAKADLDARVTLEGDSNPCAGEDECGLPKLKAEVKAEGQVGIIFDAQGGDIVRASATGRFDGRIAGECDCNGCSWQGMVGPPSVVIEAQLVDFVKVRYQWVMEDGKVAYP